MPLRLTGSVSSAGLGTLPLMSKTISGDVPQVT